MFYKYFPTICLQLDSLSNLYTVDLPIPACLAIRVAPIPSAYNNLQAFNRAFSILPAGFKPSKWTYIQWDHLRGKMAQRSFLVAFDLSGSYNPDIFLTRSDKKR
jgi:hypothetical protein